jgi:RimJ/RimL family protein N-acetyltransferase
VTYRFYKQTARLILREMRPDDAPALFLLNEDPEVLRYTGDVPFASERHAREFLVDYPSTSYLRDGYGRWACLSRTTGELLGWCGLRRQDSGEVDLGYRLFARCWGHGYETLRLPVIVARVADANVASLRVITKLGMPRREAVRCHGLASTLFALTAEQWAKSEA